MVKIFTPPFNLQKFSDQLPQLLNQQNILKSSSSKQVSEDQEMYLWRGNTLNRVKWKFLNCISLGLYPSLLKFLPARDFVSIFVSSLCHAQETSFSMVLVMCEFSRSLQPFECTSRDISWREWFSFIDDAWKQGPVEENQRKNSGGCRKFGQSTWASFQPYHYFLFYGIDEGLNIICSFYYMVLWLSD